MDDALQTLQQLASHWVVWAFLAVFCTLAASHILQLVLRHLLRAARRTRNIWDDTIIEATMNPLRWGLRVLGINWALRIVALSNSSAWLATTHMVERILLVVLVAWILLGFVRILEQRLVQSQYLQRPMDRTTARILSRLARWSVLITASLVVLESLGVSISGVLAFGGIGGLAVGFAAKDLLANFFGALMIYLDKPFAIGDSIASPDKEIAGVVDDIGWRSTLIITRDGRPLNVPNHIFNTVAVENISRMQHRRIKQVVGLRYDDIAALPDIVAEMHSMMLAHPELRDDGLIVNFSNFAASSLDISLYAFTHTRDWQEFHRVRQDLLLKIAAIVERHGAEIAYPTMQVHGALGG